MVVVNWLGILFLVIGVASIIAVKLKDIKNKSFVKDVLVLPKLQ